MAVIIELPVLSGFFGGQVSRVLVAVGDTVRVDTPLFELDCNTCTVELPSHLAGQVRQLLVGVGDTVEWGTPLLVVEPAE